MNPSLVEQNYIVVDSHCLRIVVLDSNSYKENDDYMLVEDKVFDIDDEEYSVSDEIFVRHDRRLIVEDILSLLQLLYVYIAE